jgi:hypothetical protein
LLEVISPKRLKVEMGVISEDPLVLMPSATIGKREAEKIRQSLAPFVQAIGFSDEQNAARFRQEVSVPAAQQLPVLYHSIVLNQSSPQRAK